MAEQKARPLVLDSAHLPSAAHICLGATEEPEADRPLREDVERPPKHQVGLLYVKRHHPQYRQQPTCLYISVEL